MRKLISALVIISLYLMGCGASDPLSRGEKVVTGGGSSSNKPGELPTPKLSEKTYEDTIFPLVNTSKCQNCHDGEVNYVNTYEKASALVVFGKPEESLFYQNLVLGQNGHKPFWKPGSNEARLLENWINGI